MTLSGVRPEDSSRTVLARGQGGFLGAVHRPKSLILPLTDTFRGI